MRTVIFSHNYPPKRNPRSFRIRNLEQAGFFGKEYIIIPNSVLAFSQFKKLHNDLHQKKREITKPNFLSYLKNGIRYNRISNFLSKCILPDRFIFLQLYYLILYIVKYRKSDDLIYTVSNPFSSHLIGIVLKFLFKHEWHADIGDVYYSELTSNWSIHEALEKSVVLYTDRLILNSDSIKNHFIQAYSVVTEKIHVVSNGVRIKFNTIIRIPSSVLRFSYIGNTYHPIRPGIQELEFILKYFEAHPEQSMILQLFGKQNQAIMRLAAKNPLLIKIISCNSDHELEEAYANTDILINIANVNFPGLPSKLEEYVASRIPIINFYQTKDNASLLFLNSKNLVLLNIDINCIDEDILNKTTRFISTCFN